MKPPSWVTARPIAHRGLFDAARGVPENSLAAIRAAIDAGYAMELDLQPIAGGIAVFHDFDFKTSHTGSLAAWVTRAVGNHTSAGLDRGIA